MKSNKLLWTLWEYSASNKNFFLFKRLSGSTTLLDVEESNTAYKRGLD